MDQRLKCETPNHKYPTRKHKQQNLGLDLWQYFIGSISPSKGNKIINKELGLHQTKNVLHNKGNHQQIRQPTEWENIFASTSDKWLT